MTPEFQQSLGQIAGIVSLFGFVPYVIEILRGTTRPNRATWWIWTIVGAMLCGSYYASGARHTVWVAASYVIGPLAIALLSLRYGEGGWTRFDRNCLGASLLSLVIWWLAGSPLVALVTNIGIDLLGALPTVRKAFAEPEAESLVSWIIFLIADALNLWALSSWSIEASLYPVYLFTLAGALVVLLARPVVTRGVARLGSRLV